MKHLFIGLFLFFLLTGIASALFIEVGENQLNYKTENGLTVSTNPARQIHYGDNIEACYIMNYSTSLLQKTATLTKSSFEFNKTKSINSVNTYPITNTELVNKTWESEIDVCDEFNCTIKNITESKNVWRFTYSMKGDIDSTKQNSYLYCVNIPSTKDQDGNVLLTKDNFNITAGITKADPNIDNCQTLAGANTVYTLTQDTAQNSSTCFTVSAQNITLDCAGYTITGDNSSTSYGVYSDQFNTTVKNCIIDNFAAGVFIDTDAADYANITSNTINLTISTSCSEDTGECAGIYLRAADYASINNNIISTYQIAVGLYNDANDSTIEYNSLVAIAAKAISSKTASNNTIQYNNVTTNDDASGIFIFTGSNYNTIQYNNVTVGTSNGIRINGAHNNLIQFNNATANNLAGIMVENFAANNTIQFNNISGLTYSSGRGSAIEVASSATDNLFLSNNLTGLDKTLYVLSSAHNNNFTNNTVLATRSAGAGMYFAGGGNNSIDCQGATITGSETSGSYGVYSTQANTTVKNCIINEFAVGILASGATSGNFTNNTINATRGNAEGISVSGSNNTLIDCQGATMAGSNTSGAYGVYSSGTSANTTVKNCIISNFEVGIYLNSGADSGNFTNNTINITFTGGIGLQSVSGADANNFSLNNISSDIWVNDAGAGNVYNTTNAGNSYYFSNGTASWNVYDIVDTDSDNWADAGSDYPFSNSTIGEWIGSGADNFPYSSTYDIAPNISSILIAPAEPLDNQNLTCNATALDDRNASILIQYEWYQNGTNQTALAGTTTISNNTDTLISTVEAGNLTADANWSCQARAYDSYQYSGWNFTSNVTIIQSNEAPSISAISLTPTTAYLNNTLYCNLTAIDNQSTSINISYYWFRNGTNQTSLAGSLNVTNNTDTQIASLYYAGNLSTGDNWSCSAKAYDGINYSAVNYSSNVTISSIQVNASITYPSDGSTLGMQVSDCNLTVIIQTNDTENSTAIRNATINLYSKNFSANGTFTLLESQFTTNVNNTFIFAIPANFENTSFRINGSSTVSNVTANYTNVDITLIGTTFCSGGADAELVDDGLLIFVVMIIMTLLLFIYNGGSTEEVEYGKD